MSSTAPQIFSPKRRLAVRNRMWVAPKGSQAASYLIDDMVEDVSERLAFLNHKPAKPLVVGDWTYALAAELGATGADVWQGDPRGAFDQVKLDEEQPYPHGPFDFIASLGTLDTVNDLPGALIHIRNALDPGGLAIVQFLGAGSLPRLREAMLAADGDRPAPRLHPMVDVRAGGQLLQRAGWADPVVDSRTLEVRFSSLGSLVRDLRMQGLSNALARPGPALTRKQTSIVKEQFGSGTLERFEILTLSGWRK